MLYFTVDATAALADLDGMVTQINALPAKMQDEMTAWQKDDMRRKYPNTETPDPKSVQTTIWPRSRLAENDRKRVRGKKAARMAIPVQHLPVQKAGGRQRSTRPILRQELYDKLVARMQILLDSLRWSGQAAA